MSEKNIKKIIDECFWDYHFSESDILKIATSTNQREKSFLFTKILENSTDVLKAIGIFKHQDQIELIQNYRPPQHNNHFLQRRHKILRFLIAKETVDIPELVWLR